MGMCCGVEGEGVPQLGSTVTDPVEGGGYLDTQPKRASKLPLTPFASSAARFAGACVLMCGCVCLVCVHVCMSVRVRMLAWSLRVQVCRYVHISACVGAWFL